ncbi:YceI family protein, partial [bacterium]|nr:YceI family protein [bacterium]
FKAEKAGKSIRATLVLNRAKFDVRYGSGSFFDNLGDDLILDEITLEVELKTT